VSLSDRTIDPPEHWPSAEELDRAATGDVLVILPEEIGNDDGTLTAFFRSDAQELRVRARQAGLTPLLLAPEGAEVAAYSEFTADWVLPVVVAAGLAIPTGVVTALVHDRIDTPSHEHVAPPIVRYREAVIDHGRVRLREIEGPADEVERLLRERGDRESQLRRRPAGHAR
jgi:hypothetical protein